jgi:hypothetical protein
MAMSHEGGCLCGRVRFKAVGEPVNVRICHCRQCQLAFGQPFNARAFFLAEQVTVNGKTASYPTSGGIVRVFCPNCGTRVFSMRPDGSGYGLPITNFDDRNAFAPDHHIWVSEMPTWLKMGDGKPVFPEGPPQ